MKPLTPLFKVGDLIGKPSMPGFDKGIIVAIYQEDRVVYHGPVPHYAIYWIKQRYVNYGNDCIGLEKMGYKILSECEDL